MAVRESANRCTTMGNTRSGTRWTMFSRTLAAVDDRELLLLNMARSHRRRICERHGEVSGVGGSCFMYKLGATQVDLMCPRITKSEPLAWLAQNRATLAGTMALSATSSTQGLCPWMRFLASATRWLSRVLMKESQKRRMEVVHAPSLPGCA